jgi:hypothetical protein
LGKRYMVGERMLNLGAKFNVTQPVNLFIQNGNQVIVVGDSHANKDRLNGVPIL